ncbi:MAG: hypothetical protein GY804_11740 [Alphaproteobacteria bacterium]|nr:hypothetical protein [Alphaproteobacteria bacterium]
MAANTSKGNVVSMIELNAKSIRSGSIKDGFHNDIARCVVKALEEIGKSDIRPSI